MVRTVKSNCNNLGEKYCGMDQSGNNGYSKNVISFWISSKVEHVLVAGLSSNKHHNGVQERWEMVWD